MDDPLSMLFENDDEDLKSWTGGQGVDLDGIRNAMEAADGAHITSLMPVNEGLVEAAEEREDIQIPESAYPYIENVVASCSVGVEVDLRSVAFKTRNSEYNPKKVNAVILRFSSPRCTVMVYQCGKLMASGARRETDAKTALKKTCKLLEKIGVSGIRFKQFKIETICAKADVGFPVRLEGLAYEHRAFCSYEPELHSGLIFRLLEPKVVLNIFVTGKLIISGSRDRSQLREAFKAVYPVLYKYQK